MMYKSIFALTFGALLQSALAVPLAQANVPDTKPAQGYL